MTGQGDILLNPSKNAPSNVLGQPPDQYTPISARRNDAIVCMHKLDTCHKFGMADCVNKTASIEQIVDPNRLVTTRSHGNGSSRIQTDVCHAADLYHRNWLVVALGFGFEGFDGLPCVQGKYAESPIPCDN